MASQFHRRLETFLSGDDLGIAERVIGYFREEDRKKHPAGYIGITYDMVLRNIPNFHKDDIDRVFRILSTHGILNSKRKRHYSLGSIVRKYH